jgi:hypothetical protein
MKISRIARKVLGGGAALGVLVATTAAQAEVVTYDFTANIDSADAAELDLVGLPASGAITGSFAYDTEAGWWGGSNSYADPSLALTIDQMPPSTTTATWLAVEYNAGAFTIHQDAYDSSYTQIGARIDLSGQEATAGSLPSTLSFGGGAGGLLRLFIGGDFADIDLSATLTSLSLAGATSTPELDPASGGAAFALLLGGAALVMGNRRRRVNVAFA